MLPINMCYLTPTANIVRVYRCVKLVLQVSLNMLFFVIMDLYVRGMVYSVLVSSCVIATSLYVYVFW